jgi:hypothetical protein
VLCGTCSVRVCRCSSGVAKVADCHGNDRATPPLHKNTATASVSNCADFVPRRPLNIDFYSAIIVDNNLRQHFGPRRFWLPLPYQKSHTCPPSRSAYLARRPGAELWKAALASKEHRNLTGTGFFLAKHVSHESSISLPLGLPASVLFFVPSFVLSFSPRARTNLVS